MDHFVFRTATDTGTGTSTDDAGTASLNMPRVLSVWGTDGVSQQGPDLWGMHVDPVIPGTTELDLGLTPDAFFL